MIFDNSFRIDLTNQSLYNNFVLNNKDVNDIYCKLGANITINKIII